ncbi:MAG: Bro-N domain-containing protein [Bacteroidales bacterium]|nr:Bro-N domain-containing protein [Bacteroidales bacterium]
MKFDDKTLSPVLINEQPHFVAVEVCEILSLTNPTESLRGLDEDEKLTSVLLRAGQKRSVNLINESGLYSLIFQSRKPEAKLFKKWVTSEVLPSIRKTGKFEAHNGKKILSDTAIYKEGELFPNKMGSTICTGVCLKGECFYQMTRIMRYVGFPASVIGATYANRLGEGNAKPYKITPDSSQQQWFINQRGFQELLVLAKHDINSINVDIVNHDLFRLASDGSLVSPVEKPYQYSHEEMNDLFFEVSKIGQVKQQNLICTLLRKGRKGGAL